MLKDDVLAAGRLQEFLTRRDRMGPPGQDQAVLHLSVDGWDYAPLSAVDEEGSPDGPGVVLLTLHPDSDIARHLSGEVPEAFSDVLWVPDDAATRCLIQQIERLADRHDDSDPGSPGSHRVFVNDAAEGEAPPGHLRVQVDLLISGTEAIREMTELWAGLKQFAVKHDVISRETSS